jgi:hypothetical protein
MKASRTKTQCSACHDSEPAPGMVQTRQPSSGQDGMQRQLPQKLIVVDETGTLTNMTRHAAAARADNGSGNRTSGASNRANVATVTRASAFTQSGSSSTPGVIITFPPPNELRKASLSSRIRSVLIVASLDEAREYEATHDFILTALLAVARALI